DSIPLLTVSAASAARSIVAECREGQTERVLGWPANQATLIHELFPGLTTQLLGLANQLLLPSPGGIGTARAKGYESETGLTQSFLAAATHRAEEQNNELSPEEQAARARRCVVARIVAACGRKGKGPPRWPFPPVGTF